MGAVAGTVGGRVDRALMRVVDTIAALPHLLLGIFIVAMLRPSLGAVIASIALTHWLSTARIVRSELLSLRSRPFIDAAISGGAGRARVLTRHLLPHVLPRLALATTLMVPHAVWHETALSFLGLGLPAAPRLHRQHDQRRSAFPAHRRLVGQHRPRPRPGHRHPRPRRAHRPLA